MFCRRETTRQPVAAVRPKTSTSAAVIARAPRRGRLGGRTLAARPAHLDDKITREKKNKSKYLLYGTRRRFGTGRTGWASQRVFVCRRVAVRRYRCRVRGASHSAQPRCVCIGRRARVMCAGRPARERTRTQTCFVTIIIIVVVVAPPSASEVGGKMWAAEYVCFSFPRLNGKNLRLKT